MDEHKRRQKTTVGSVQADSFAALFAFQEKAMALLQESSLEEEKLNSAVDEVYRLIEGITAEVQESDNLNLADRLDSAFDEVKRLVDQLSEG